ncbi:MAG: hypothetical protein MJZ81_05280 [Bacteroidales bacterium]|nr:hypothetical protein [Bacteroidales bacterium]
MKKINIHYWTNLLLCCGSNVFGRATLELEGAQAEQFLEVLDNSAGEKDLLAYFDKNLPQELAVAVRQAIEDSFERVITGDAISHIGYEIVYGMGVDEAEWEAMSFDEQIDCAIKVNPDDNNSVDYEIVSISVKE